MGGKWGLYDKGFYISRKVWYECSNCGMKTHCRDECFEKEVDYNYCPDCGAKWMVRNENIQKSMGIKRKLFCAYWCCKISTEAEYIERSYIRKMAMFEMAYTMETETDAAIVLRMIDDAPAADVAPVVHGWWESVDSSYWRWTSSNAVSVSHTTYRCGRCGWGTGTVVKTNYCPNCGAKMDEKEAVYD